MSEPTSEVMQAATTQPTNEGASTSPVSEPSQSDLLNAALEAMGSESEDAVESPETPVEQPVDTKPQDNDENASEANVEPTEGNETKDERPAKQRLREKELEKKLSEYEQQLKEYNQLVEKQQKYEALKKENPLEFLQENGLTLEQLTDYIINGQQTKEKELSVEELVAQKIEEYQKQQQSSYQEQQNELVRQQVKLEIKNYIVEKSNDYPVLSKLGEDTQKHIFEMIVESAQTAKTDADILTVEQAAKQLNDEILSAWELVNSVYGNQQKPAQPNQQRSAQPKSPSRTLTNSDDGITPDSVDMSKLTEREKQEILFKKALEAMG